MKRALRVTLWWALALSIVTFLLWPLLTLAAGTVWSEGYFTFWIILSIVWGLVAGTAQPDACLTLTSCIGLERCLVRRGL